MAPDPYKYFRIEAREILEGMGKGVLDLEKGARGPDLIPRLLRLAHTLKGAARVVKQLAIADAAHSMEDALEPYRKSSDPVAQEVIDKLLELLDATGRRVAALENPQESKTAAASQPLPGAAAESIPTVRFDTAEMDDLIDGLEEAHSQLGALRKGALAGDRTGDLVDLLLEQLTPRLKTGTSAPLDGSVASIAQELQSLLKSSSRQLNTAVEHLDRELRQVRDAAERLRLVPASALFTSLERCARDVAHAQAKRVRFEGRGGNLRLDVQLLGVIQSALVQVVRNATAHGIEVPAERQAAGKPAEGCIRLDVFAQGAKVTFRCRDDGRGIDVEAVRRSMVTGPVQRMEAAAGAQDVMNALLRGGISTSRSVTELSGRGVGMDVVRDAAKRLGGKIELQNEPGKGLVVDITVPLSVSSLRALVVETAGIPVAFPLDAVRRTARIAPKDLAVTASGRSILHNGKTVPFMPLARLLDPASLEEKTGGAWSAVIMEDKGTFAAIGVDGLRETSNIVVRPVPELAPSSALLLGVSLDVEGVPRLVLDPEAVIRAAADAPEVKSKPAAPRRPVLVVDDSLTTRMLEQSILESAGYEVDVAVSGEEGLEKAGRKRYGLFLVDVEMPGIDGFTFVERKQADPLLRDIPAILVTSRDSAEDRKRGMDAGAYDYVIKNQFNQQKLLENIRKLVG